jgi:hypothetical protein
MSGPTDSTKLPIDDKHDVSQTEDVGKSTIDEAINPIAEKKLL